MDGEKRISMQQLELSQARAGMVLGEDVLDRAGQLLLRAGTVLSDQHLQLLRAHAVGQLRIGTADGAAAPATPRSDTDIEAHIETRFCLCDDRHPLIRELRRLCRERLNTAQGETDDD